MKSSDNKPIYQVLTMEQIIQIPWNGFNAVSTFSGCGGSCLGYRMAGYKVLWANEFIPEAQKTYKANHPNSILDTRDIRKIRPGEILEAINLKKGELDIFDGSPPCSSFSTAGKREAGRGKVKEYSDTKQRTDDLFFEYTRILNGLQPKIFVAENVSGLIKGTAKGYFLEILKALKSCGYNVKCKVLDAQWLGVPQMRQRTIFIGVREDLGLDPVHPKPLDYQYTVRDALPWVTTYNYNKGIDKPLEEKSADLCVANTVTKTISGGNGRVKWNISIDQSNSTEKRKFSIAELRRICAFPDDFILTGSYAQQWERLGRAVPPVMMMHIAKTIQLEILEKL